MRSDKNCWQLRVAVQDRPGALAALATTLGVHDVDVLRIDVVSREDVAVDDIWIQLPPGGRIDSLEPVLRRLPGVAVRALFPVAVVADPVIAMASACAIASGATDLETLQSRVLEGACLIANAEHAALVSSNDDGSLYALAATGNFADSIAAHEPSVARDAAFGSLPIGVPGSYPWAPQRWCAAVDAAWIAAVPLVTGGVMSACLIIVRERPMAFESGELSRLAEFASVLVALVAAQGPSWSSARETVLMPRGERAADEALVGVPR